MSGFLRPTTSLFRQFISFAAVGAVGTVGHYVVLIIPVQSFKTDPVAGSAVGFVVGALINYFLNYHLTFQSTMRHDDKAIVTFFAVALFGFVVNTGIMSVASLISGLDYLLAQVFRDDYGIVVEF